MQGSLVSPEVMTIAKTPLVTFGYVFQLLISLAIVVGLFYFSAKYLLPKLQLPSSAKNIELLDRLGLEPQVSLYTILAHGKKYLIGVSNKVITLIDKLESGS